MTRVALELSLDECPVKMNFEEDKVYTQNEQNLEILKEIGSLGTKQSSQDGCLSPNAAFLRVPKHPCHPHCLCP